MRNSKHTRNVMWRRQNFFTCSTQVDQAPTPLPPTCSQGPVRDLRGIRVREIVERNPWERFLFSPRIENRHLYGNCYRICKPVGSLDSTDKVGLLASFGKELPKKVPSSPKRQKKFGKTKGRANSYFLASSFFRLSSLPGFASCIHTYGFMCYLTIIIRTIHLTVYSVIQPITE